MAAAPVGAMGANPVVNPVANPVAAAAALLGQVPGHYQPTAASFTGGVHQYTEYGYQTMQMPGAIGAGVGGAAGAGMVNPLVGGGMGGGIDLGGFSLPAGPTRDYRGGGGGGGVGGGCRRSSSFSSFSSSSSNNNNSNSSSSRLGEGRGAP